MHALWMNGMAAVAACVPFAAQAASFDCAKASTAVEKAVCAEAQLNDADARLGRLYSKLYSKTNGTADKDSLKETQRAWLQQRARCDNPTNPAGMNACLLEVYQQRIQALEAGQPSVGGRLWQFTTPLTESGSAYRFVLRGAMENEVAHIKQIDISNNGGKSILQSITEYGGQPLDTQTLDVDGGSGFMIEDVNFDGYKDIRLMELLPAGPNVPFIYWLFDPASKKFSYHAELSELTEVRIDAATKQIHSQWRESASQYGKAVYQFINGKLTKIKESSYQHQYEDVFELTVREWTNGQWHEVERSLVRK